MKLIMGSMALLALTSCEIINPAEDIPSYIHVDSFSVNTNTETQGSHSSNISDVWVTVDGKSLGAYELPATLPVLASGNHQLLLSPGILVNGIATTRASYPFYSSLDSTVNFESAKTETIKPQITYADFAHFQIEDFDHSSVSLEDTSIGSNVHLVDTNNANSIDGDFGYAYMDGSRPYFKCASINSFPLPGTGANVYAELNYKCSNEFTFGLIANASSGVYVRDIIALHPSDIWKKIYIYLTPTVSEITDATGWKIYIHATKSDAVSSAELFLDNIKIVY
jgi:hypothetical protein